MIWVPLCPSAPSAASASLWRPHGEASAVGCYWVDWLGPRSRLFQLTRSRIGAAPRSHGFLSGTVTVVFCRHSPPPHAAPCGFHIITLKMCFQEDLPLVTRWNKCSQSPSLPKVRIQGAGSPLRVPVDAVVDSPSLPRSGLRDIQPPAWPHKCSSVVPGLRAPAPSSVGKVGHTVHTRGQLLGEPETRNHPPSGCN